MRRGKEKSCSRIGLLLAAAACCLLVQDVSATLLFSEGFDYSAGSGIGSKTNQTWNSVWQGGNNGMTIAGQNLTYGSLVDLGGNALLISNASAGSTINQFASQTSGPVYYSFLFQPLQVNPGNRYFTALNPGTSAPNGSSDAIDAYYYSNGKLYLRANALAAADSGVTLTIGQTYLVVEMLDLTARTASMWINPTPGNPEPAATVTLTGTSASIASLDNVGFKAQSDATGKYLVDNLLIGTTWADVTAVIPEPSTFALAATGLGLMIAMIRRRRS